MEAQGMVERVARAIWAERHGIPWEWGDLVERYIDRMDCLAQARAAIEAMREPTEAMMNMGETRLDRGGVYLNWIQMIDAALNEHVEKKTDDPA